eukprot:scaffold113387_cov21-Tisochrysis_lutea.AAC.4
MASPSMPMGPRAANHLQQLTGAFPSAQQGGGEHDQVREEVCMLSRSAVHTVRSLRWGEESNFARENSLFTLQLYMPCLCNPQFRRGGLPISCVMGVIITHEGKPLFSLAAAQCKCSYLA